MAAVKVHTVEYHRDGVGGAGFHVVQFTDLEEGRRLVGVVFEEPSVCAVLDVDDLATRLRGTDFYEKSLRSAIELADATRESFQHRD